MPLVTSYTPPPPPLAHSLPFHRLLAAKLFPLHQRLMEPGSSHPPCTSPSLAHSGIAACFPSCPSIVLWHTGHRPSPFTLPYPTLSPSCIPVLRIRAAEPPPPPPLPPPSLPIFFPARRKSLFCYRLVFSRTREALSCLPESQSVRVFVSTLSCQMESFGCNQIGEPLLDSLKYITPLGYDVMTYVILDRLTMQPARRRKVKEDGINLSDWLLNIAQLTGMACKRFPGIEITALCQVRPLSLPRRHPRRPEWHMGTEDSRLPAFPA